MKYKNGIFRALLGTYWLLETRRDNFFFRSGLEREEIKYPDITQVLKIKRLISCTLRIEYKDNFRDFDGFSEFDADRIKKDLIDQIKKSIIWKISIDNTQLQKIKNELDKLLKRDIYLGNSDIRSSLKKIPDIGNYLSHPYFDINYLPENISKSIEILNEIKNPDSEYLQKRNSEFVQKEITKYNTFFLNIENKNLTKEQKEAAVICDDRNMLIAAAGSGKSSTIIAKIHYLIEKNIANSNEILVLTYNKDAQLDLERRFSNSKLQERDESNVVIKTFHAYATEIIGNASGKKPSIAKIATGDKEYINNFYYQKINFLCEKDKKLSYKWIQFLTLAKHPLPSYDDIKTLQDYDNYRKQAGAEYTKNKSNNHSLRLKTIDNNMVNSMEELRIYNWLVINGVNFKYEKPYEISTASKEYRQYYPDFFYTDANIYHEHFALNKDGKAPYFFKNYLEGVTWKRNVHRENNTKLIETTSHELNDIDFFNKFEKLLINHGVKLNPLDSKKINEIIKNSFDLLSDIQIFPTFMKHFKANNFKIEEVEEKFKTATDKYRANLFFDLFKAIYKEYKYELENKNEIDFEDVINLATDYINNRKIKFPIKYILIDEFQDISQDRKKLIQSILSQSDEIKLFVVGDDWQSIYRFSGSDVDIMTNFEEHFGLAKRNYLTKTFRGYQGITNLASIFVAENPKQLKKNVISEKDTENKQIHIVSEEDLANLVAAYLNKMDKAASKSTEEREVFILGRYNHDIKNEKLKLKLKNYKNLKIKTSTIHQSKGLEADYILILNVTSGKYGFPNSMNDDPILSLVMPTPEDFIYAEERRLFYVALTRAKRRVIIFTDEKYKSQFIDEIIKIDQEKVINTIDIKDKRLFLNTNQNPKFQCPRCGDGKLLIKNSKDNLQDPFFGCSNWSSSEIGCLYTSRPAKCPSCQDGNIVRKVNKYTQDISYACSTYNCNFIWKKIPNIQQNVTITKTSTSNSAIKKYSNRPNKKVSQKNYTKDKRGHLDQGEGSKIKKNSQLSQDKIIGTTYSGDTLITFNTKKNKSSFKRK
ncbi:UvrD-helicase domain-containing protein [Hyphomicrobiales bacterium]|nr:UvrD-helicase domain-containing protein [Hyphomicrobiales bacterium]